jgi:hypothetical protein
MRWAVSVVAVGALTFAAVPSRADVTITMTTSRTMGKMTSERLVVIYVKGMKGRIDMKAPTFDHSILIDVTAKQQLMLNIFAKQTVDLTAANAALLAQFGDAVASLTPLGQTKDVLGRICAGYEMLATVRTTLGNEAVSFKMSGPIWLATSGPDVEEWVAFTKAALAAGIVTSQYCWETDLPAAAATDRVFAKHGIPVEMFWTHTVEGNDRVAQQLAALGKQTVTTKVTAISTNPIPDEMFTVPVGYTKK